MELGIYTFAELTPDPETGRTISPSERLRDVVEEMELADQVGLDVFGVGEHHRPDFAVSAPAVVLAAGAERTQRIRLTSAVNVISSDDPVRVFEQFATLDLLSGGRAEIMAGRGSFIESFPLFGYDLDDPLIGNQLDETPAVGVGPRRCLPRLGRGVVGEGDTYRPAYSGLEGVHARAHPGGHLPRDDRLRVDQGPVDAGASCPDPAADRRGSPHEKVF